MFARMTWKVLNAILLWLAYSLFNADCKDYIGAKVFDVLTTNHDLQKFTSKADNYHSLEEIYSCMDSLKMNYSSPVSVEIVGYTYKNRPIKCIKVSSGVPGAKGVLIDGETTSDAFSEPETKSYSEFIRKLHRQTPISAYIAFHSQLILFPYAYAKAYTLLITKSVYPPAIGQRAAEEMVRSGGETYEVGTPGDLIYSAAGGAYDWVKETVGVKYSFTYELRDTGNYGFLLPAWYIKPTAQEAFVGFKVMMKAATK